MHPAPCATGALACGHVDFHGISTIYSVRIMFYYHEFMFAVCALYVGMIVPLTPKAALVLFTADDTPKTGQGLQHHSPSVFNKNRN